MNWIQRNLKTIIYIAFLVPIISVAVVSISHVTTWYGLSNPASWALYLSVGIEIAALSALAAISAQMGRKVYVPFGIVTLIQFIGNIFFAYQYIDVGSKLFLDWIDLVDPLVQFMGIESTDIVGHKRFLAFFSGGMLPLISLSFLHMLVKFEEEEKNKKIILTDTSNKEVITENENKPNVILNVDDLDEQSKEDLSKQIGKIEYEQENEKFVPTEEMLLKLQEGLEKLNKLKFGQINEEELVQETPQPDLIVEEQDIEPIIESESKDEPLIKRLNYLKRDA
jgi:hypothetical protein